MRRILPTLAVVSLFLLGCSQIPTGPSAVAGPQLSVRADCTSSNTNNGNNPPATAGCNNNNNNNNNNNTNNDNNPPTTAKN